MAITAGEQTINAFVKGFVTEAGPLTFPVDASIDELNMALSTKGIRRRRLGLDYENLYAYSTASILDANLGAAGVVQTYLWNVTEQDEEVLVIVLQIGTVLYFYNGNASTTSDSAYSFTVDFSTLASQGNNGGVRLSFASGKGSLFCANSRTEPFYLTWDDGNAMTAQEITIQVRDFSGLEDGLDIDEMPTTLSDEHKYNLLNQGWANPDTTEALDKFIGNFFSAEAVYPSNVQTPFAGIDEATPGTIDTDLIKSTFYGSTYAPQGHFILDAFNKDRSTASGIVGLPVETTNIRPAAVAFFSGRVWYAFAGGVLYYSQVLQDNLKNIGYCFQEGDPASKDNNELVDTDGGEISVADASEFVSIVNIESSLLVLGRSGCWAVQGESGGFKATDFAVNKLVGGDAVSDSSLAIAEGTPVWFGEEAIYSIEFDSVSGRPQIIDISSDLIKEYYDSIPLGKKRSAKALYDKRNKQIIWLLQLSETEESEVNAFSNGYSEGFA